MDSRRTLRRASTMEMCVNDAQDFLSNKFFWTLPERLAKKKSLVALAVSVKRNAKKNTKAVLAKSKTRSGVKAASKKTTKAKSSTSKKTYTAKAATKKASSVAKKRVAPSVAPTAVSPFSFVSTPLPAPSGDVEEIKKRLIQSFAPTTGPVKGIDVVFSFDITGSMSSYLNTVKNHLSSMIQQLLTDLPTIRIGLICHGDYCDGAEKLLKATELTNQASDLVKFVNTVGTAGGGDEPEAYEFALRHAGRLMKWEPEHAKALVVIGDAYPHEPSYHLNKEKLDWKAEVAHLASSGVKIYSVQCGSSRTSVDFFRAMAEVTSGSYLDLTNMGLIRDMFLGVCYREGYEAELATNAERYEGLAEELEKELEDLGTGAVSEAKVLRPEGVMEAETTGGLSDADMLKIHEGIHGGAAAVKVLGKEYRIAWGTFGNRYLRVDEVGVLFIQQNVERSTKYAQMARDGKKITWICKEGKWGVIIDGSINNKLV